MLFQVLLDCSQEEVFLRTMYNYKIQYCRSDAAVNDQNLEFLKCNTPWGFVWFCFKFNSCWESECCSLNIHTDLDRLCISSYFYEVIGRYFLSLEEKVISGEPGRFWWHNRSLLDIFRNWVWCGEAWGLLQPSASPHPHYKVRQMYGRYLSGS